MGCVAGKALTEEEKRDRERNAQIERELAAERKLNDKEVKVLLLGAGESGKSTIAKQMKFIYLKGFTEQEKEVFKRQIHQNIIFAMQVLLKQCRKRELEMSPENEGKMLEVLDISLVGRPRYDSSVAQLIADLWEDPAVQKVMALRHQFTLSDSAQYFLSSALKYADESYQVTNEDVLRVRAKTTGIVETAFVIQRKRFRMVDVGGQRNERKKWIHCFQDVTAIIYCASLSDYDMKLEEDPTANRMHESLQLFEDIINNEWFCNTPIILFLNKKDLFEEKMAAGIDLQSCFPQYEGGQKTSEGLKYIAKKYKEKNLTSGRDIFCKATVATDTTNIRTVFDAVQSILIKQAIGETLGV